MRGGDLTVERSPTGMGESARWCDVCIRAGNVCYTCAVCQGRNFDLCLESVELLGA